MTKTKIIRRFPHGSVTPPPSKSLSHRAALCAALAAWQSSPAWGAPDGAQNASYGADASMAAGDSVLDNFGKSQDIDATLCALCALLPVHIRRLPSGLHVAAIGLGGADGGATDQTSAEKNVRHAPPVGTNKPLAPGAPIDCGESGSTLRFLLPLAALFEAQTAFTGRGRLLDRPLDVYETLLPAHGAALRRTEGAVYVHGTLRPGLYAMRGDVSSQFVSGLLLTLPLLDGDSEIILTTALESRSYATMTVAMMRRFGVFVQERASGYLIPGRQRYRPAAYRVEADYSGAAFFLAAAALGCDVCVDGLSPDSDQGDSAILSLLTRMGAALLWDNGRLRVKVDSLQAIHADMSDIPDLTPPLAALCCCAEGQSRLWGVGRLRLKESDRLRALTEELSKLGARISLDEDTLVIEGRPVLPGGARADAWNDHRIAMAIAVASIRAQGETTLTGYESVEKSYPDFWRDFEKGERT